MKQKEKCRWTWISTSWIVFLSLQTLALEAGTPSIRKTCPSQRLSHLIPTPGHAWDNLETGVGHLPVSFLDKFVQRLTTLQIIIVAVELLKPGQMSL
jgi:hypothetical protein